MQSFITFMSAESIMSLYWKDIVNDHDEWIHLALTVGDQVKPRLRLQAGGNNCFKLTGGQHTYFWGRIEQDYYGAWIMRNENNWAPEQMPIQPINSTTVQESAGLRGAAYYSFWSKYFAQALETSQSSLLYPGKWTISAKLSYEKLKRWTDYSEEEMREKWQGFYKERPVFLDWGFNGSFLTVALKEEPDKQEGRVKWWRKQVKQGTCPPVLVWFVSSLQAYVIIDGHSRLKAFHLENEKPEMLVLGSVIEYEREPDIHRAETILENIKARQNHHWKKPLSIDEVNRLLIEIYDNRPFTSSKTRSMAKPGFEKEWIEELTRFKEVEGLDHAELEAMIAGQ